MFGSVPYLEAQFTMSIPDSHTARITCCEECALILLPMKDETAAALDLDLLIERAPRSDEFYRIFASPSIIAIDANHPITCA